MNSNTTVQDKVAKFLVENQLVTSDQIEKAQAIKEKDNCSFGLALVRIGAIEEPELLEIVGKVHNLPVVALDNSSISPDCIDLIPAEVATKFQVIPIQRQGRVLTVGMANPSNIFAIDDIKFITGLDVQPVVCSETTVKNAIDSFYAPTDSLASIMEGIEDEIEVVEEDEDDEISAEGENAPVVKLVNTLLAEAVKIGASDIHIEPYERNIRVRYRIDGVLDEVMEPPVKLKNAIISRIKIMAELDIAERRVPQDGRIKLKIGDSRS